MKAIVDVADALCPRINAAFAEYAQSRGFGVDPTRVRSPMDKGRVERTVAYGRGSLFAGEEFIDLGDAQRRAEAWCVQVAGQLIHGTTGRRPAEVFAVEEAPTLLPGPVMSYDLPVYSHPEVHRDGHVEVAKAIYSLIGRSLSLRPTYTRSHQTPGLRWVIVPFTWSTSCDTGTGTPRRSVPVQE